MDNYNIQQQQQQPRPPPLHYQPEVVNLQTIAREDILTPPSTPAVPMYQDDIPGNNDFGDSAENQYVQDNLNMLRELHQEQSQSVHEEVDKEILIECVSKYPCIWHLKSPDYKNGDKKKIAWQIISSVFENKYEGNKI